MISLIGRLFFLRGEKFFVKKLESKLCPNVKVSWTFHLRGGECQDESFKLKVYFSPFVNTISCSFSVSLLSLVYLFYFVTECKSLIWECQRREGESKGKVPKRERKNQQMFIYVFLGRKWWNVLSNNSKHSIYVRLRDKCFHSIAFL